MADSWKTKVQLVEELEYLRGRVRELEAAETERQRAEEALWKARDELERRGEERTAELSQTNARLAQEITERERIEKALRYQVEFETRIAMLSKHFLNLPAQEIDGGIDYALQVIGEFAEVDRSYLFLFADNRKTKLNNTHEWCAQGIDPQMQNLQGLAVESVPWWMQQLSQFAAIHIPRVTDLPAEAAAEKKILQAQNIQSLLVVPVVSEGSLVGFLGFDAVREERTWSAESMTLLTMVGEILANAVARQRTDTALRENEERFRQLAENIREVFWMSAPDKSQLLYVSPAYEEIWGRACTSLLTEPRLWIDTIYPEDRDRVIAMVKQQCRGELTATEYRVVRPDGTVRWIWDRSFPVLNEQGEVYRVVGIAEDITERKRVEESLRDAKEAAESANRAKTEFLATMSHELRTPLHIVLGYTDLILEQEFGPVAEKQDDVLRRVRKNARALQDLITAVLEVSRLEAGRLPVTRREVQIPQLLKEVTMELEEIVEQSGLVYVSQVAQHIPPLYTDPDKLKVVLKNLIGNAVKFTEKGSITIQADSREGGVEISVSDTGIGIHPDARSRIFEPFYQGDSSSTRLFGGAGFGLYIVKRLLELLEGTVTVDSKVGQGSTFRIWIPFKGDTHIPVFDLQQGQWTLKVKE